MNEKKENITSLIVWIVGLMVWVSCLIVWKDSISYNIVCFIGIIWCICAIQFWWRRLKEKKNE